VRRAPVEEAIALLKSGKKAKFDETLEVSINLEAGRKEVTLRGSVEAPAGLGDRGLIFAVFCDEKIEDVNYCGGEDLINKFLSGEIKKCDVCICTKKYFPLVSSKIGKILGRRRIMPDARFGTVTEDNREALDKSINSFKKGRMNFRVNKNVVHTIIGKMSFETKDLVENFQTLIKEIKSVLPEKTSLGKIYLSPTMGGSVEVVTGGGI